MEELKAFIALGSNSEKPEEQLLTAYDLISKRIGPIELKSSIFKNPPLGFESRFEFANSVVRINWNKTALELLDICEGIEKDMGRIEKSTNGYSDRIIDLDIIMFGNQKIDTSRLQIPHPLFRERIFVLKPFSEIAPELIDPVTFLSVNQLFQQLIF